MDSDPFLLHVTDTAIKWICHDQLNTLKTNTLKSIRPQTVQTKKSNTLHIHQTYCRIQIHNDISEK